MDNAHTHSLQDTLIYVSHSHSDSKANRHFEEQDPPFLSSPMHLLWQPAEKFILMKSIPASDLSDVTQFPSLYQSQLLTSSGPLLLFCCVCFWGWTSIHTEKRIVFLSVCYLCQCPCCCYRIVNAHVWYPWKVKLAYCVCLFMCLYSIWVGTVYVSEVSEWVIERKPDRFTIPHSFWTTTVAATYIIRCVKSIMICIIGIKSNFHSGQKHAGVWAPKKSWFLKGRWNSPECVAKL